MNEDLRRNLQVGNYIFFVNLQGVQTFVPVFLLLFVLHLVL